MNQLGDNVISMPLIRALSESPDISELFVATSPIAADLYRGFIPESNLLVYPTRTFLDAWKNPAFFDACLKDWRKLKLDAALIPFDQGNVPRLLSLLSGARLRVGATNPRVKTNICLNRKWTTDRKDNVALEEWQLGQYFAETAGLTADRLALDAPPEPDLSHLTNGVERRRDTIHIHAGASDITKRWPIDHYIKLANRLSETFRVVWSHQGDPAEHRLSSDVERQPPGTLKAFVRQLASATLFIGNNSGPMHVAAAVQTPTISFAGPAPVQWDPFWRADENFVLRNADLRGHPCATVLQGVTDCATQDIPVACLKLWKPNSVASLAESQMERFTTTPLVSQLA